MLKWILIVLAVLVGTAVLVTLAGMLLPRTHAARSVARLTHPPDTVWMVVRDFEQYAAWWRDARAMERLPDREGHEVWGMRDRFNQTVPLEVVTSDAPTRLVTRIADERLPFGGTWTYEIAPREGGSQLSVTERGTIGNPVFRLMARFVFGYHASLDGYLRAVGRRLGDEVSPEHRPVSPDAAPPHWSVSVPSASGSSSST